MEAGTVNEEQVIGWRLGLKISLPLPYTVFQKLIDSRFLSSGFPHHDH
jgi:hypothetical protein